MRTTFASNPARSCRFKIITVVLPQAEENKQAVESTHQDAEELKMSFSPIPLPISDNLLLCDWQLNSATPKARYLTTILNLALIRFTLNMDEYIYLYKYIYIKSNNMKDQTNPKRQRNCVLSHCEMLALLRGQDLAAHSK